MPNGDNDRPYNFLWCKERHEQLNKKHEQFDKKIQNMEMWFVRIVLLLVGNLTAACATLLVLYIQ